MRPKVMRSGTTRLNLAKRYGRHAKKHGPIASMTMLGFGESCPPESDGSIQVGREEDSLFQFLFKTEQDAMRWLDECEAANRRMVGSLLSSVTDELRRNLPGTNIRFGE